MQFELDSVLTDQILFYMEDQDGIFVLDTHERNVLSMDDDEYDKNADEDRYISLPDWGPSEGYRLMERFTAGLRNAMVREELSSALNSGRGVFRAFKNTLTQHPETEKTWYAWKDREMKREVISWYNALREIWGLELIGEEPEDISGLALEDFRFRNGTTEDTAFAEELHKTCLADFTDTVNGKTNTFINSEWLFPGDISFIAETAGGEFAGYICAVCEDSNTILRISALEVKPEFRGLGIGKTLITRLFEFADKKNLTNIIIDIPAGKEHFSKALLRESFKPCIQRYCRVI